MASKTIDIAVVVRDAASSKLKSIEKQLNATSRAAMTLSKSFNKLNSSKIATSLNRVGTSSKKTGKKLKSTTTNMKKLSKATEQGKNKFLEFNRTIFTTTAFVGLFAVAFSKLKDSMFEAAKMDRVVTQFEKSVGPKGDLIRSISAMTDNSIDIMESMKTGIALRSLGIATSMGQVAEFVARAGTAGKLAGKDSAEGIKQFTAFMKDGSIAHLEFLNLISRNNAGLKITQTVLAKYGGIAGGALTAAQRLAIGQELLRKATDGALKGQRDYADVLHDVKQFSVLAAKEGVMILVAAFAPLLDKVKDVLIVFSDFAERIRKNDKEILFLVKSVGIATTAIAGLFLAMGTLNLAGIALTAVGISVGPLATILAGVAVTFLSVTSGADSLTSRLKVFGAVFKGTFQLVKSFISDSDNFAKGIGKMDSSLANLLKKHGLFGFVTQLSRVISSTTMFLRGFATGAKESIDFIIDKVGGLGKKLFEVLGIDPGVWSRFWVEGIESIGKSIGRLSVSIIAAFAAFKAFQNIKGMLGNIPVIGKLFGGKSSKSSSEPKGTASDPIYTKDVNAVSNMMSNAGQKGFLGKFKSIFSAKSFAGKAAIGAGAAIGGVFVLNKIRDMFKSKERKESESKSKTITTGFDRTAAIGAIGGLGVVTGAINLNKIVAGVKVGASGIAAGAKTTGSGIVTASKGLGTAIRSPIVAARGVGTTVAAHTALKGGRVVPGIVSALKTAIKSGGVLKGVGMAAKGTLGIAAKATPVLVLMEMLAGLGEGLYNSWDKLKSIANILSASFVYGVLPALKGFGTSILETAKDVYEWLKAPFVTFFKWLDDKTGIVTDTKNLFDEGHTAPGETPGEWGYAKTAAMILKTIGSGLTDILLDTSGQATKATEIVVGGVQNSLAKKIPSLAKSQAEQLQNKILPSQTNLGANAGQRNLQLTTIGANLKGEKKDLFKQAVKEARSENSKGKTLITAEEMDLIMRRTIGEPVDILIKTTKKNKPKDKNFNDAAARGCG